MSITFFCNSWNYAEVCKRWVTAFSTHSLWHTEANGTTACPRVLPWYVDTPEDIHEIQTYAERIVHCGFKPGCPALKTICCCCCCGSHCLTQFHVKLGLGKKGLRLHFMSQAHLPVRTWAKELFPIAPIHIGDRYQTPQEWAAYIACSILRCLVPLRGKAISKNF